MDKKTIAKNVITIILVQVVLSAFYPLMSRAQQWDVKAVKTITGRTIEIRDLKEYILKHMDSLNIPGLSIAVINNGIVAYSANLGVKNFTSKEPVDTNTIFEACSLSKPVFAYFTLVLANRGVLNIDTPLYRYCMDKEVDFSDQSYKNLTARIVLNHASGWLNWREHPGDLLKFKFKPGTRSGYSGEGYQHLKRVLGYLLDADDCQLNGYVQQAVVEQLHIRSMNFTWMDTLKKYKVFGHVNGQPTGNGPHGSSTLFDAAAGLHTDAKGYARFLVHLMDRDDPVCNRLLKLQDQLPPEGDGLYRSLGFPYKLVGNKRRYFHSGNNGDTRSYCHFYRNEKMGIVMFCNSDNFFSSGFAKKVLAFIDEEYPYE